jgi:hypothetical protein
MIKKRKKTHMKHPLQGYEQMTWIKPVHGGLTIHFATSATNTLFINYQDLNF